MKGQLINFTKRKEEIEVQKQREIERIQEEEAKTIEEFEWYNWKEYFYKVQSMVGRMNKLFSYEEQEEWTWKIYTHLIRSLIDSEHDHESIMYEEELDNFIRESEIRLEKAY